MKDRAGRETIAAFQLISAGITKLLMNEQNRW